MIISIIAAMGKNNELGKDNQLLWQLPADMKHFREITTGHTVIMGRKTYESIGRPLPNRRNIVITRETDYQKDGIEVVHSLPGALKIASLEQGKKFEENDEDPPAGGEVFIIGGGQIYIEAIANADKLYITHVDATLPADTYFPQISCEEWEKISSESHKADEKNPYPYTFSEYKKI